MLQFIKPNSLLGLLFWLLKETIQSYVHTFNEMDLAFVLNSIS